MKNLSVHLTDTCNNSCIFCVVGSHVGTPEKVNRKLVYEFLKENKDGGFEFVNLHGGEPTLLEEFPDIIRMIKELGYPNISVQTNGRLLSNMEFAKQTINDGVNLCVISLHGHTKELQDYFADVENSFDEAVRGIKNVISLGCKVRTNICVCKQNYTQLADIVKYSMSLGVSHINISNLHTAGNCLKNFELVVPKLSEAIPYVKVAVDACVEAGVKVTLEGYPMCVLGDYSKYLIDWEENQFKMLYKSFVFKNYNTFMENNAKMKGEVCKECAKRNLCGGVYKEYAGAYGFVELIPEAEEKKIV
ncbi:radical SAM protein [Blautia liquoris]|jgi:MoaA/NifB/PqqE/SkfB family radical SAM enzyme|uniref:Radical SAM protein n=1 Tax=Blautia liquoris TaxID=2779518 RepID=A0A7M2RFT8_9FIRM|nr:radical SAM protein [Blautia liquoris]QOV19213.1 radical SAM protein [Blautia liquoris]